MLAVALPLPIQFESRRRHLQRFLKLPSLSVPLIWFPLIEMLIRRQVQPGQRLDLALDRTQWRERNLLLVGVILFKRAIPVYWQFLDKKGASNLREQQAILRPVFKLLKTYHLVVLGDREFHNVDLAKWLKSRKVSFVLRQKKSTYLKLKGQAYQPVNHLEISPGIRCFFTVVRVTKAKGFGGGSFGVYWKRKYRQKSQPGPWYLLTDLPSLEAAILAYKKRSGIEALFKDCKTGGYNLEGSRASTERLTRLVLLIAIAYTCATFQGQKIKLQGQGKYLGRHRKGKQIQTNNSNFWLGLSATHWRLPQESIEDWVEEYMNLNRNKRQFYQKGLRAMSLSQQAF